jgi:hypothetical protein
MTGHQGPASYATYFDRNYLFKGLSLYRSMERHAGNFELWVLCLDEDTYALLSDLRVPRMRLVPLSELEKYDPSLLAIKETRSIVEYFWTCTACWILYLLENKMILDVTYLDADLFLYSSLTSIESEFGEGSVLIVPHRFSRENAHMEARAGIYNVSLLRVRADRPGLECMHWWRERCLANCALDSPEGTCGDQKYLDDWPSRFEGVVVLKHKGAGLAPWNLAQYLLTRDHNGVLVDSDRLVFYHFHSFGIVSPYLYETCRGYRLSREATAWIYRPYIRSIHESIREVRLLSSGFRHGIGRGNGMTGRRLISSIMRGKVVPWL